jgi:hypothetical protein
MYMSLDLHTSLANLTELCRGFFDVTKGCNLEIGHDILHPLLFTIRNIHLSLDAGYIRNDPITEAVSNHKTFETVSRNKFHGI